MTARKLLVGRISINRPKNGPYECTVGTRSGKVPTTARGPSVKYWQAEAAPRKTGVRNARCRYGINGRTLTTNVANSQAIGYRFSTCGMPSVSTRSTAGSQNAMVTS